MDYDIHSAKTNLSRLIKQAEAGEEIFLVRRGHRVIQLTPVQQPKPKYGTLRGKIAPGDDALLFAMSDEDADAFIDGN